MLEKCPVSFYRVRHLSCLNPVKMASNKEVCSVKFKKVVRLLVNAKKLKRKDVTLSYNSLLCSWTAFQFLDQKDLLTFSQLKTEWIPSALNAWQMKATRVFSVLWNLSWFYHMDRQQLREVLCQKRGRNWQVEGTYSSSAKDCLWPCEQHGRSSEGWIEQALAAFSEDIKTTVGEIPWSRKAEDKNWTGMDKKKVCAGRDWWSQKEEEENWCWG